MRKPENKIHVQPSPSTSDSKKQQHENLISLDDDDTRLEAGSFDDKKL